MKNCFAAFLIAGMVTVSAAHETPVLDVRAFGAKGDGHALDTAAIQHALDECGKAGGGTVRLPAGVYLSKPIFLKSNTTLQLDQGAKLQATDEPADFANPERRGSLYAFVNGNNLINVSITGQGIIDGAGARWWPPIKEAKRNNLPDPMPRPRLVILSHCTNARVEGVTLQNSPMFHLVPSDCENVEITNVTILAPADSPNTDAIDPSTSRHVHISKCVIDVGDDHVAIKSGRRDPSHPDAAACEDITVTDCTMRHGHGISIGSETTGGVSGLTVERCTFENSDNGLRIKSTREKGGLVENLIYRDISMTNVKVPIIFTGYYPKIPATDGAQAVTSRTPMYRNIRLSNVTGTSPQSAGFIVGLPEAFVSNVVLENVRMTAPRGLTVRNATAIKLVNTSFTANQGPPIILETNATVEYADAANRAIGWDSVPGILARIKAPEFPARNFPITDFGAKADGTTDCTEAIAKAIAACHAAGGGHVIVAGGTFLTGAVHLLSNVDLHIDAGATLQFSPDRAKFLPVVFTRFEGTECMNYSPLIYAFEQENIAVTGGGTLDGSGAQTWWGLRARAGAGSAKLIDMGDRGVPVAERVFGDGGGLRPNFIQPCRCRNVLIEGVRITNSPMWEIHPLLSTNVTVRGVNISSHGPNNDGCDPECSRDVLIENCVFDTGDDCIAIKSGKNADGRRVGIPSENIIVRGCTMKDGHGGVVVGSEVSGSVSNVFAENCTMDSPNLDRALRLKSNAERGGVIENVFMRNVKIGRVKDSVLTIDLVYGRVNSGPFPPVVRNVVMENITATASPRVLNIVGTGDSVIEGVRLEDCNFHGVTSADILTHAGAIATNHITIEQANAR